MNTVSVRRVSSGAHHTTPVWNVSIDEHNNEQVDRYLKRQQRLPDFVHALTQVAGTARTCARQNATQNVYEVHYEGDDGSSLVEDLNPTVSVAFSLRCGRRSPFAT